MHGKTIELFWVNGTAESIITAELSNWNGKAIKLPRTEVSGCSREDIAGVGVYFLLCQEDDGTDSVYIGEAENVHERLLQQTIRRICIAKDQVHQQRALSVKADSQYCLVR